MQGRSKSKSRAKSKSKNLTSQQSQSISNSTNNSTNTRNQHHHRVTEIATIAVGVATLIGGGAGIYMVSSFIPIPGMKYIFMAPFISMILYVMQIKVNKKQTLLKFGAVFALVMTFIHLVMGLSIISTTLLAQATIIPIRDHKRRAFIGSVSFSGFMCLTALSMTKWLVGGLFENIPYSAFILVGMVCAVFGIAGTWLAGKVLKYLSRGYL